MLRRCSNEALVRADRKGANRKDGVEKKLRKARFATVSAISCENNGKMPELGRRQREDDDDEQMDGSGG